MRIGLVTGVVTLSSHLPELRPGRYLIIEALDRQALQGLPQRKPRSTPMPESLVAFDELGAGPGQIVAFSEGREACVPFHPARVPVDAYCAAILDNVELTVREN